jgi:hypothetical protein
MADINKELSPDISGVEEPTSIIPEVEGVEEPTSIVPEVEGVEGREPAYVYGYYSLVDPETGEKHLIYDYDHDPPAQTGSLEYLAVVFRAVDGKETRRVEFRHYFGAAVTRDPTNPTGVQTVDLRVPGFAALYYFPLIQDRSEGDRDPRMVEDDWIRHHVIRPRRTIRYNPDRWRFATVEVGPLDLPDPDGSRGGPDAERYQNSRGEWRSQIPLTRRAEPFPDLPDMPPFWTMTR